MAERAEASRATRAEAHGLRPDTLRACLAHLRLPGGAAGAQGATPLLAGRGGPLCVPRRFFSPSQERRRGRQASSRAAC